MTAHPKPTAQTVMGAPWDTTRHFLGPFLHPFLLEGQIETSCPSSRDQGSHEMKFLFPLLACLIPTLDAGGRPERGCSSRVSLWTSAYSADRDGSSRCGPHRAAHSGSVVHCNAAVVRNAAQRCNAMRCGAGHHRQWHSQPTGHEAGEQVIKQDAARTQEEKNACGWCERVSGVRVRQGRQASHAT